MICSMTGYGRCRSTVDGLDITVEIKSVNSRFLDCTAKISRAYGFLEERVKPFLQSKGISRGKIDVFVSIERLADENAEISLDEGYLKGYLHALETLRDTYGLRDDISVMSVARNSDLFSVKKPQEDVEHDWACLAQVLSSAADALLLSRRREGESIAADLRQKLDEICRMVERIAPLSEADVASYRQRLAERIREALGDNQLVVDEGRLLTECAIHADKVAVDEELVRLRTHLDAFAQILEGDGPVGRRLDFLLQEINREVNTTGSKCNDAEIARIVVDCKCELEKIREQIQNME